MIPFVNKPIKLSEEHVQKALDYIDSYWPNLVTHKIADEGTLIGVPYPYVMPSLGSGNFSFHEQYYWDSFFISLGLDDEELVSGMLDNLIFLFDRFGLIPNANRYYSMSRSQPPLLTTYIFYVYDRYSKSVDWLETRMQAAVKEYQQVWTATHHPHDRKVHKGLSRYYDINYLHDLAEAESGWDMTPRFQRKCLDFIPVDLNCLLYKYETDFARWAEITKNYADQQTWTALAEERKESINELLWNKRKKFYFDYNYIEKKQSSVWSLAGYYALWCGVADKKQAKSLADNLFRFEKSGGLTTTSGLFMYPQLFGSTKTQWAFPNGWAPLHYFATEGLEAYGYHKQAERIARKWMRTNLQWFEKNGEFLEKYNVLQPDKQPSKGVYPSQTGFGWTNGVFCYYSQKYLAKKQPNLSLK